MKAILFILIVIAPLAAVSRQPPDTLRISGTIADHKFEEYYDGEFVVNILDDVSARTITSTHRVPIRKGSFRLNIPLNSAFVYVRFSVLKPGKNQQTNFGVNYVIQPFLLSADSLDFALEQDSVFVSGRGAERFICQYAIHRIPFVSKEVSRELRAVRGKHDIYFDKLSMAYKEAMADKLDYLDGCQQLFSPHIYGQLKHDIIGLVNIEHLKQLRFALGSIVAGKAEAARRYFNNNITDFKDSLSIGGALHSLFFSKYLVSKWYTQLVMQKQDLIADGDLIDTLYGMLKTNFEGELRDRILFLCLNGYFWRDPDGVEKLMKSAVSEIETPYYWKRLVVLNEKLFGKNPVPDFQFVDTAGNSYTLGQFKGKTLVIDFWFSGCVPCRVMAAHLKPFIEKYVDRENLMFVTINIDRDQKVWEQSLESGLYTSPHQLNLNTGKLGAQHPLILHYGYYSYPQIMVIDGDGQLVTTNVPRLTESDMIASLVMLLD